MSKAQLRQTYYDKIYNYRPAWIVRWGLLLIFLIMMLIFISAWFIKYPDVVNAVAEVTTINPPAHVTARVNGKITRLWVKDSEMVKKGDRLAMIETTVLWDDIVIVKEYISQINQCLDNREVIPEKQFHTNLKLGELQQAYNALLTSYNEYVNYNVFSYTKKEIASSEKLLAAKYKYWSKQNEQKNVYDEIYTLAESEHSRDKNLYESDVISASEMEQSSMGLLQRKATLKDLDLSVAGTVSEIRQMEYNIEILRAKDEEKSKELIVKTRQAVSQLSSLIDIWEQNYIISSPASGKVAFTTYWTENQNINAGDIMMSIVPPDTMRTIVRVQLPMHNSGKVKAGQRVNIKLENYPYSQFGFLQGKIASISAVPNKEDLYTASVKLNKGLVTSYNKKLGMGQYLKGSAEILTDDYSLLLRLFNPLKAFIDEKVGSGEKAESMNKHLEKIDKDFRTNSDIKWNFTKFLIDRDGKVISRFEPTTDMNDVEEAIKALL